MKQIFSALNADFLFPMLHGKWAVAAAGESLNTVIEHGRDGALGRLLNELGIDTRQRSDVQRALTRRLIDGLGRLMRVLDAPTARFYGARIERHAVDNIRTLLHYRHVPDRGVPIRFLLIDSPYLPPLDVDRLLAAENARRFFECLPPHGFQDELRDVLAGVDRTGDMLAAECGLDRLYFQSLLAAARGLSRTMRRTAVELVGTEIDVTNIMMIMRNAQLYRLPPDGIGALRILGGHLFGADHAARACNATARADIVAHLPGPYRELLTPLLPAALHVSETALWRHLHRKALAAFRDFGRPSLSVVAFPFLKRAEMLNVGRVFEGLHFGLEPLAIRATIIGTDHVSTS